TVVLSVAILVATGFLFVRIPKGFIPDSDNDQLLIQTEAEQGISFDQMSTYEQQAADIVRKDPAITAFFAGVSLSHTHNRQLTSGRMFMHLKPRAERGSLDTIIGRLRQKLSGLPYMRVYLQNPPTIRIGGQVSTSLYQYTLQGPD